MSWVNNPAAWPHAHDARGKPSRSIISSCTLNIGGHEEFMHLGDVTRALGKIATFTIWPC
jgi:hypothetical protein